MKPLPRQHPVPSAVAALAVFGDSHYPQYLHWQANIDDPDKAHYYGDDWRLICVCLRECGHRGLPTPIIYKAFMNWLRLEGELYTPHSEPVTSLVVATCCRHPIHPGNNTQVVEACPMCVMRQCVDALTRIWQVWEVVGAPNRQYSVPEDSDIYMKLRGLWRVEKQRWSNLVAKYEEWGEYEEAWEDSRMADGEYTFEELNSAQSCRAALQVAWTMNPVKLVGHDQVFEPKKPLTRSAWKPAPQDAVMLPLSPGSPMFASQFMPSSPPLALDCDAIGPDEPPPMFLFSEQPASPPSSPLPFPAPSPPTPPRFPLLETSKGERSTSSEFIPSETSRSSSSLPASPPPTPMFRKKRVAFAEDVLDLEKRYPGSFSRFSPAYSRGRHACPSAEGWADTSFKHNKSFWELEAGDEDEIEDDDVGTPYQQLLNSFGIHVERAVPDLEEDSDMDSDSDSDSEDEDDESDESDRDVSPVIASDDEGSSTRARSPWRQLPYLPRTAFNDFDLDGDSDAESISSSDSDEYEDKDAEMAMSMLGTGPSAKASLHSPVVDTEMVDVGSVEEQDPEIGDIGLYGLFALGRRDREEFEGGSSPSTEVGTEQREVKRQRRDGA
ncbi:hypothetical protein K458DRAFT_425508 [Lentithecium fluviatile CBS 122367]|uniref:Uncharacterized protein n=1 Tax=Lentithecium fluviatile CBS 122367 TaxID=1168545 RepID=A0A6G1JLX9_9PLEO|nr:hypothetical protein K458DRAFT_425508 [Lentithecium fluviatile CBS 122367]